MSCFRCTSDSPGGGPGPRRSGSEISSGGPGRNSRHGRFSACEACSATRQPVCPTTEICSLGQVLCPRTLPRCWLCRGCRLPRRPTYARTPPIVRSRRACRRPAGGSPARPGRRECPSSSTRTARAWIAGSPRTCFSWTGSAPRSGHRGSTSSARPAGRRRKRSRDRPRCRGSHDPWCWGSGPSPSREWT